MNKPIVLAALVVLAAGCDKSAEPPAAEPATLTSAPEEAQKKPSAPPTVKDPNAPKNVVDVASASSDHTTLVKALEAADYVDSLTNPGPFTVFAPTNAAFDSNCLAALPRHFPAARVSRARSATLCTRVGPRCF